MKLIPSGIFFWSFIFIYFLPSLYTLNNLEELALDNSVGNNYLKANLLFLISLLLSFFVSYFVFNKKEIGLRLISKNKLTYTNDQKTKSIKYLFKYFIILLNVFFLFYFIFQTLPKLLLLGSDIDPNEFRLLGFDDRNLYLTFILEIARRGLYPLICLYLILFYKKNKIKYDNIFYQTWIIFFLISLTNLDRGPIFLFILIIIFYVLIISEIIKKNYYYIFLFALLSFVIACLTYIQYNVLDFDFTLIKNLSYNIILKRVVLDPSLTSYRYSFELIRNANDFLYLKYSRLFSLISGNYINSSSADSIFVTPVGIVGDLWRNFGNLGIFIFGFIITSALNYIYLLYKKSNFYIIHLSNLLVFILVGAILFGGIFSYQPFFLYFLIILLNKLPNFKLNLKKN